LGSLKKLVGSPNAGLERCKMKTVQTVLNEAECRLLADYSEKRGQTIRETLREAALRLIMSDTVQPEDPVFTEAPLVGSTGKKERTSAEHDRLLYGVTQ
jgi:hypothetical protein